MDRGLPVPVPDLEAAGGRSTLIFTPARRGVGIQRRRGGKCADSLLTGSGATFMTPSSSDGRAQRRSTRQPQLPVPAAATVT